MRELWFRRLALSVSKPPAAVSCTYSSLCVGPGWYTSSQDKRTAPKSLISDLPISRKIWFLKQQIFKDFSSKLGGWTRKLGSRRYRHGFWHGSRMKRKACGIDSTPLSVFNFYFGWWPARINFQISTMSQTGEMCHEHGSWVRVTGRRTRARTRLPGK